MTEIRCEVFASRTAKMVLRDRWSGQTAHRHRPVELIMALDGPIALQSDTGQTERSHCFLVPPMRRHALLDYRGRVVRIYLDVGYRRLTAWKDQRIRTDLDVEGRLRNEVESFFVSRRGRHEAGRLMDAWLASWLDVGGIGPPCDRRVAAVLAHLDSRETPTRADRASLAKLVSLSPTRLAAIFAEDTGMSLSRYLVWRRVKVALALVCEGSSITHAAAEAGFSDGAHLTRSCRATYGCTPSSVAGFAVLTVEHGTFGLPSDAGWHHCLAPHEADTLA